MMHAYLMNEQGEPVSMDLEDDHVIQYYVRARQGDEPKVSLMI